MKLLREIQTLESNGFTLIIGHHLLRIIHPLGPTVSTQLVVSDYSEEGLAQKLWDMRNYADQLAEKEDVYEDG